MAVALAKVGLVVDCINYRGTMVFAAVMLPPHAQVVSPTDGKMSTAKIHNCCECESLGFSKLVEGEGE